MPRLKAWKWDAWAENRRKQYLRDAPDVVAVDTETTGVAFFDHAFCATLTWRGRDGSLQNAYIALDDEFGQAPAETLQARIELVYDLLERTPTWVFHNAKFDLQKLALTGALPNPALHTVEDTQAIYYQLNENEKKGLKDLAVRVLKHDDTIMVPYKSGKKKGELHPVAKEKYVLDSVRRKLGLKIEDGYYWIPREYIVPYALRDTDFTLELFEIGRPEISRRGLDDVYAEEIELQFVMLRTEGNGLALDLPYLEAKTSEYGVKVMEAAGDLQELTGRPEFNPNTPAEILEAFESLGITIPDTKKSTLKSIIEHQAGGKAEDLARRVLQYRSDKKVHGTYLSGLLAEQREGIVHPYFNLAKARTGRMTSSGASAD